MDEAWHAAAQRPTAGLQSFWELTPDQQKQLSKDMTAVSVPLKSHARSVHSPEAAEALATLADALAGVQPSAEQLAALQRGNGCAESGAEVETLSKHAGRSLATRVPQLRVLSAGAALLSLAADASSGSGSSGQAAASWEALAASAGSEEAAEAAVGWGQLLLELRPALSRGDGQLSLPCNQLLLTVDRLARLAAKALASTVACLASWTQRLLQRRGLLDAQRRQLEAAAVCLASGCHALTELWLSWGGGAAAGQPPQQPRAGDQDMFISALLAATQHLTSCPAAHLVEAAVPQLVETALQLVSAHLPPASDAATAEWCAAFFKAGIRPGPFHHLCYLAYHRPRVALRGGGGRHRHWVLHREPAAAAASAPAVCNLDVQQGPITEACHLVTDVCVDQQLAILHGQEYQRPPGAAQAPAELPLLQPSHRHRHYRFTYHSTGANDYSDLPPLRFRAATTDEPMPYLSQPAFSSCTVPVVYYSHYLVNPAHMFRDNAAILYGALNESSWGTHAKVVLMTSFGLAPPRFASEVMAAVTPHMAVESWAQFSSRLSSQQAPGGGYLPAPIAPEQPGGPRASWEGGPQRCFKHMYVCADGVNSTETWPLHAFGRHLAKHHLRSLPAKAQPPLALQRRLRLEAEARNASGLTAGTNRSSTTEPAVLSILFHRRGVNRMLLNAAELLEQCNAWNYTTTPGVQVRALCSEVELTNLTAGIMAAQRADIFIGAHGANMVNGWLMRPCSSVLELTMHQFEERFPHEQCARRNMKDASTEVQYWKVLLCDERRYPPGSWTPGPKEEAGRAAGQSWHPTWPKFRSLAVRWEVIDLALREIVETGGDMGEYRRRWDQGRWWWLASADQAVYAGPNLRQTCRAAEAAGLTSTPHPSVLGAGRRSGQRGAASATARLCALQCLQHACVSWHKVYMGSSQQDHTSNTGADVSSDSQPEAAPPAAAECLALCGAPADDASCLAQVFDRLLNTRPLEYSCSSACMAGLLASSCQQCHGSNTCRSFAIAAQQEAECVVDATL
ncbi:hypothetical protein C2E21_3662 [Chlorella sorokiniana]|uniref:Uncharacterized protein n=1 Tax=Chlorella sorokiniana TaxID=3076 RepID=A0A2P6TV98_CHLSO|nr:hypothetical protein C2E21_3662 [Chlorella sorokiniana]|eukprot:PRW57966.1 hypothetical protein C2E21_3662 [Chlorella sorokiniana]